MLPKVLSPYQEHITPPRPAGGDNSSLYNGDFSFSQNLPMQPFAPPPQMAAKYDGDHGLGRSQLRNAVGWPSRRAVATAQKVPAQTSQVATSHGSQEKVLKELAQGESLYQQIAYQGRQHHKGFPTQDLQRHQQKP